MLNLLSWEAFGQEKKNRQPAISPSFGLFNLALLEFFLYFSVDRVPQASVVAVKKDPTACTWYGLVMVTDDEL